MTPKPKARKRVRVKLPPLEAVRNASMRGPRPKAVKAWARELNGAFWVDDCRMPVLWPTRKLAAPSPYQAHWSVVRVLITEITPKGSKT